MTYFHTCADTSAFVAWLDASYQALHRHHHSVSAGPRIGCEALVGADSLGTQIQLWWTYPEFGVPKRLLWDYVDIPPAHAAPGSNELRQLLHADPRIRKVTSDAAVVRPKPLAGVPLFDYHPLRFRALNPLGKPLAQLGASSAGGGFTMEVLQAAMDGFVASQEPAMAVSRLRRRLQIKGRQERDAAQMGMFFADYHHHGKQLFDFPPSMVELFARTDVDGIPLELIRFPHRSMYLHFGRQGHLEIEGGWAPDGAYVALLGQGDELLIQFCLTFAPEHKETYGFTLENPEPCYIIAVPAEQCRIGVGEAVDQVLAQKLAELRSQAARGCPGFADGEDEIHRIGEEHGFQVSDGTPTFAAQELERLVPMHKAWEAMLRLVVNALAYLSAYPDDWDLEVARKNEVPWAVLSELGSGQHKRVQRAKSKLAELGYAPIHLCGRDFRARASAPGRTAQEAAGDSLGITWVRGHWKRQVHGPQRSLRRLAWLMPYRRSVSGSPEQEHGHIYLVT